MRYFALLFLGIVACGDEPSTDSTGGNGGSPSASAAQSTTATSAQTGGSASTCSDHVLDCDAEPGCETDILVDAEHCAACGHACEPGPNGAPACVDASCTLSCLDGYADCNGIVADGCETDPLTSVWNCGGCGIMCLPQSNATPSCAAGDCVYDCDVGYDDCNGDPNDGCEVPLSNDPSNCGACGNSCPAENGTAMCTLGHCAVEITVANGSIRDIAVSGGYVYVALAGVHRVPLSGGPLQLLGSGTIGEARVLAVSGGSVYFIQNGSSTRSLFALPLSGGTATQVAALNPNPSWPTRRLAADATTAYWIESFMLTTVPLSGGAPTTWGNANAHGGPAVGTNAVYWTGGSNFGDVFSMPLGGGTTATVLDAFGPYDTIAVAGGFAYIASFSALERVPLSGGAAQLLASGLDPTYYLATDGLHVYLYTNTGNSQGEIVRVPAAGGTPEVLASLWYPSLNYGGIAVDGTHVYWAAQDRIRKMPK